MKIKVLQCPQCHANLKLEPEQTVCFCSYCGAQIAIEEDKVTVKSRLRQKEMAHEADMCDKKHLHEVNKIKIKMKEKRLSEMLPFLIIGVCLLICFMVLALGNIGSKIQETKLENTVSEVMELIDAGDYDAAYVKAQLIYWDSSWTSEPEEKWKSVRESVLETIQTARLDSGAAIKMPSSAKGYKSENYEEVIKELNDIGFTNIETEIVYDLTTGWLVSDGDVDSVSINGETSFKKGEVIDLDAEIIVTYHTFKKNRD